MVYNFLLFLLMRSLVLTSHSSVVINLDAFLNSQLQLTTFHKESLSQSLIFKHSHLINNHIYKFYENSHFLEHLIVILDQNLLH